MRNALLALCGALLLASCQSKAVDVSGAGFVMETPSAASRDFIIKNDRPFAEQVAVNRAACSKSPGCQK